MKMKTVNTAVGVVLILLCAAFYALIPTQIKGGGKLLAESRMLPRIALILIVVLSLTMIYQSLRKGTTGSDGDSFKLFRVESDQVSVRYIALRLAATFLLFALYVFTLNVVGYILATFVFLVLFNQLLGEKRWWVTLLSSLIATVVICFFVKKVNVFVPQGLLERYFLY